MQLSDLIHVNRRILKEEDLVVLFRYKNYPIAEKEEKEMHSILEEKNLQSLPIYVVDDPNSSDILAIFDKTFPHKSGFIVIKKGHLDCDYHSFNIEFKELTLFQKLRLNAKGMMTLLLVPALFFLLFKTFDIYVAYNISILLFSIGFMISYGKRMAAIATIAIGNYLLLLIAGNGLIYFLN